MFESITLELAGFLIFAVISVAMATINGKIRIICRCSLICRLLFRHDSVMVEIDDPKEI